MLSKGEIWVLTRIASRSHVSRINNLQNIYNVEVTVTNTRQERGRRFYKTV